ncbi:MAG: sulfur carrier protein ThiS adenylyltransferase ThiF [Desulfobacter sp.]|nr:sulfur carrier protein ThiS adenylyltransferase ThiF [Desulfobacter sp.]WDP84452.1 MAG: sulfur carrier protein ThiS adenylyltransferase ThiF [Desulfobacter sp.]
MIVGIAGAGGIGSNVARHLAQAGVLSIQAVDFDRVDFSNLNRQFYTVDQVGRFKVDCLEENLKNIFPAMAIEPVREKLIPGGCTRIFKDCSLVVEGLDNAQAKKMLVEELAGAGIPVVSASGIAGRDMTCVRIKKMGICHIVGDFSTDEKNAPLFPPKVAMIAALMAAVVLTEMDRARDPKSNLNKEN